MDSAACRSKRVLKLGSLGGTVYAGKGKKQVEFGGCSIQSVWCSRGWHDGFNTLWSRWPHRWPARCCRLDGGDG